MRLYDFDVTLDKDGDLACYTNAPDGHDLPVYITRNDFVTIASAFGYEVVSSLMEKTEPSFMGRE